MTLDHLFIPENKRVITDYYECQKDSRAYLKRQNKTWKNLCISKDKNCNGLNYIKYV